jgi:hypothetical protein
LQLRPTRTLATRIPLRYACAIAALSIAPPVCANQTLFTFAADHNLCVVADPTCSQLARFGVVTASNASLVINGGDIFSQIAVGLSSGIFTSGGTASNPVTITGPVDFADSNSKTSGGYTVSTSSSIGSNTVITNGTQMNTATLVSNAQAEYASISNYWAAQQSIGNWTGNNLTLTGQANHIYVYDFNNLTLSGNVSITGTSSDLLIFNVGKSLTMNANAQLSLQGLDATQVLFNFLDTKNNDTVLMLNSGALLHADAIVQANVKYTVAGNVWGAVYGGKVDTWDGEEFITPEPGTIGLFAGCCAVLLIRRRTRKNPS